MPLYGESGENPELSRSRMGSVSAAGSGRKERHREPSRSTVWISFSAAAYRQEGHLSVRSGADTREGVFLLRRTGEKMKELMSFCRYHKLPPTAGSLPEFLRNMGLDGIEQLIYETEPAPVSFQKETVGVHLKYWPDWMNLYMEKHTDSEKMFSNTFGEEETQEGRLAHIRGNLKQSLLENPEYLVWHISQSETEEAYTFRYRYTDREVLRAAADVFNAAAANIPDHVAVLFENLWWPGLRLRNAEETEMFFSLIRKKNVGIMLDTGHLMNTEPALTGEEEAADFICRTVESLGKLRSLIRGIHLSCSLSGVYQREFSHRMPENLTEKMLMEHIISIDQHQPFHTSAARQIAEFLKPDYIVHELICRTPEDLEKALRMQIGSLRGSGKSSRDSGDNGRHRDSYREGSEYRFKK